MAKNKKSLNLESKAELILKQEFRIDDLDSQLSSLKIQKNDIESALFEGDWENDEAGRDDLANIEEEIADLEFKYTEAIKDLQLLQELKS